MQYVVFGMDGYIGSYLFEKLKNDGYNVIGTSRRNPCNVCVWGGGDCV